METGTTPGGMTSLDHLRELRRATRAAHDRVENHPVLHPLIAGTGLDTPAYRSILRSFLRYYRVLEAQLVPALQASTLPRDYVYRQRSPLLAADLADLGELPLDRNGKSRFALPDTSDHASLLGTLYVIEGATRGGRIVMPRLTDTMGTDMGTATRYFGVDFPHDSGNWRALTEFLRNQPVSLDTQRMIEAARCVFAGLHASMDGEFGGYITTGRNEWCSATSQT